MLYLLALSLLAHAAPAQPSRPCSVYGLYRDAYPKSETEYRMDDVEVHSFDQCASLARKLWRQIDREKNHQGEIVLKARFTEMDSSFSRVAFERGFVTTATLEREGLEREGSGHFCAPGSFPVNASKSAAACLNLAKTVFQPGAGTCAGRVPCLEGITKMVYVGGGFRLTAWVRMVNVPSLATLLPFLAD